MFAGSDPSAVIIATFSYVERNNNLIEFRPGASQVIILKLCRLAK